MPLISKVEPTKKGGRFSIFLDNDFAFSVSDYVLGKYKLTEGSNFVPEQIELVVLDENKEYLKEKALNYLGFRPRSEKEVFNKINEVLSKRLSKSLKVSSLNIPKLYSQIIDSTLEFLKKYDYLNDEAFAKWLVEQRVTQGKGPMFIKQDLYQKGINKEISEASLEQVDFSKALNKEYLKATKKCAKIENEYKRKSSITRYLVSRGFSYDQIENLLLET
ncbi:hypothetical protein GW755_01200 [bacterium]|nr:hypothetical protein [bacterium]